MKIAKFFAENAELFFALRFFVPLQSKTKYKIMSTKFFTNENENTLLNKIAGLM
jgi:hypothetical protein